MYSPSCVRLFALLLLLRLRLGKDGSRRTTRYDRHDKIIFGFCAETCPVDAIVEVQILSLLPKHVKNYFMIGKVYMEMMGRANICQEMTHHIDKGNVVL